MDHANRDEIPAASDAIDVCASKNQSALIGGDEDFVSICRVEGPRIGPQQMSDIRCLRNKLRAPSEKRKPLFALVNDELRAISTWQEKQDFKARSEAT